MTRFNVDSNYFNHPKVKRLKVYCGQEADIFPIRLWAFCAEYFPKDGILKGYLGNEIEGILGWNGIGGNLIRALEQVGFIEKCDKEYKIHDWEIHAGFVWKYKQAGRKAGIRSGKSRRSRSNDRSTPRSTACSTMEWNGMEYKEEDSLMMFKKTENIKPTSQEVLSFPTAGLTKSWSLTESKVSEFSTLFPGVDILTECKKALSWIINNRKKTARGMPSFLNRWISKANDDLRNNGNGQISKKLTGEVIG